MKNKVFKTAVSLCMALILSLSAAFVPGFTFGASAEACTTHSFTVKIENDKTLRSAATCSKRATYYYTCANCEEISKDKFYETGKTLDHTGGTEIEREPNCTMGRRKSKICTLCKQEYGITYIDPTNPANKPKGHTLSVNPLTTDGEHNITCKISGCGYTATEKCSSSTEKCGEKRVCDICKDTFGKAVEHDFKITSVIKEATCTASGLADYKCDRCGAIKKSDRIEHLGHDYEVSKVIKAETCTENGEKEFVCKRCGDKKTEAIPALGHDKKIETVPADCYKAGSEKEVCSRCKTVFSTKELPKLEHILSEPITEKEPTCKEEGSKVIKCTRENCGYKKSESIAKTDHKYETQVIASTCEVGGYTLETCKFCGTTVTSNATAPLGHESKQVSSVEATCETDGKIVFECLRCKKQSETKINKLGHNISFKLDNNATCETDGTKTGTCSRCNKTVTETIEGSKLGHKYTVYIPNNDATCQKNGTEKAVCDNGCGKIDTREISGSKLPHTEVIDKGFDSTCVKEGLTEGKHCSVCNEIIVAQETIPQKAHEVVKETLEEATCSKAGKEKLTCKNCDYIEIKEIPTTEHKWNSGVETKTADCENDGEIVFSCEICGTTRSEVIPAKGHNWDTKYTVDREPTCSVVGRKSKKCLNGCGKETQAEDIPKLEHTFGPLESDKNATCFKDGTKSRTCTRCGEKKDTVTDPGTKLTHSFVNYIPDGNATCLKDGTKTALCENGCGERNTISDPNSATGHSPVIDGGKEATCTETGLSQGSHCRNCEEVLVPQEVIPALGHKEEVKKAVAPTCTKAGRTEGVYCSICKRYTVQPKTIKALGHKNTNKVTKATTSKDGMINSTCKVCGAKTNTVLYKVTSFALTKTAYAANGKPQVPKSAVVKDSKGNVLKAGTDYEITYDASKLKATVGTYSVKIVLKGNYSGSKNLSFKIVPGTIKISNKGSTTTTKTIGWTKAIGANGYRVYILDSKTNKFKTLKSSTTALSYKATGLTVGKNYTFAVKPYYKTKSGAIYWGSYVKFETSTAPGATSLTLRTDGPGVVKATFSKATGATGYVIYYSTSANGKYQKLGATKALTFTNEDFIKGGNYYFKARAYRKTVSGNVYGEWTKPKLQKVQ